ncbi:hypothetical protein A5648_14050 [Mycolicibacter sinensis]|uniref:AAA family ATPase n=2 Tax=Mycolicibacter sinensis (strain JDM601) TaxID=875328 RepID=A0A1A3U963_MYCSD|nr:hypothetical protein A5648_14050 [Mycolicibacter sinensis]
MVATQGGVVMDLSEFEADWADVPPPDDPWEESHKTPAGSIACRLLTRSALENLPDPQPLIDNVLDQGTSAILYGKWGTGKSFVALDWAASVATSRNWQGRTTVQRRVLYVAAEGAYGLKGRLHAWEAGWQVQIPDERFHVLPRPVNLTRPLEAAELVTVVADGGYGMVVLDTLARCMVGGDENHARDTGLVIDVMSQLREATPGGLGVVLGVHHTGKDGKTLRGSSSLEAGVDTVYSLTAEGRQITLDREKRKDGPPVDRHVLKIDPVEGTGSAVISLHFGVECSPRNDALYSAFLQHFSTTGATNTELRKVTDLSEGSYYRARDDLLKRGLLVNTGTEKRPFYKASQS